MSQHIYLNDTDNNHLERQMVSAKDRSRKRKRNNCWGADPGKGSTFHDSDAPDFDELLSGRRNQKSKMYVILI